jgi:prepilin-type N-terminal cleavage/methylation domain-containing protein
MVTVMNKSAPAGSRRADQRGYTLVEILVALAISTLVVGGAVVVTTQVQEGYGQQLDTASSEQEARYALDWIQRLLRQAGSDPYNIRTSLCLPAGMLPSVNGFPAVQRNPLVDANQDNVRIFSDVNPPDGLIGGPGPRSSGACTQLGEDVTVAYDASKRVITLTDNNGSGPATEMTDTVVNRLQFDYLDRNGVATTNMATLAWVRVTVETQAKMRSRQTGSFQTYPLSVDVRLRPRW